MLIESFLSSTGDANNKFMLASDGVSESQEVLRVYQESSGKRSLQLVAISSFFESQKLAPFLEYKTQRLSSISNTSNLDVHLNQYKSYCSSHSDCSMQQAKQDLINTIDNTQDMMHATIAIVSAFKQVHQSLCGSDVLVVCDRLLESSIFYEKMLSEVKIGKINISLGDQDFEVEFDENSDKQLKRLMPVYKLSGIKYGQNRYTFTEVRISKLQLNHGTKVLLCISL